MARRPDEMMLRQVRTLFNLGVIGELTDGQLLERFATSGGEATELAFAALVERHGPMVLRICRNNLRDPSDVEDAFQAAFLVLVQRARSLWVEDSLAPWMHRVARRIAVRARSNTARRRESERRAAEARPTLASDDGDDGLMALLHEEIDRLPEPCRVPVVLCDLEGLTHEQAARHLSWAVGTVKSRLTRGRDRLRARLVRRGVAPAVALVRMAMPARSASAAVPAGLVETTIRSACRIAAGAGATTAGAVPATVALLMEGAFHTMFLTRIKLALLACGLIAGGAVVAAQQAGPARREKATPPATSARAIEADAPRSGGSEEDEAVVARDMAELEEILMDDEVDQLRAQVKTALQERIRLEMQWSRSRGPIDNVNDARDAYKLAREAYLEKARELSRYRHRKNRANEAPREARETPGEATPAVDPFADREARGAETRAPAAVIGSIDIDAVIKRYAKSDHLDKQFRAELKAEQERLTKRRADAEELASRMEHLAPGSQAYLDAEEKLSTVRKRYGRDVEELQREFARRKARQSAALLQEFREVTASVARARGFDYVVESAARPDPDADEMQVVAAWKRAVLYANPRNDITEEVIRELNRRYEAAGDKGK